MQAFGYGSFAGVATSEFAQGRAVFRSAPVPPEPLLPDEPEAPLDPRNPTRRDKPIVERQAHRASIVSHPL